MRPVTDHYFGVSGIPCVFTIDDDGNTAIGYIVRQIGSRRFVVTNGSITKTVVLAHSLEDVADLHNMPPGMFTILVTPLDGDTEHIRSLSMKRCTTIQGNTFSWHLDPATPAQATVTVPDLVTGGEYVLLEDGSKWLLETGDRWQLEHNFILLEDGSDWLLETGDQWKLEGEAYGDFFDLEGGVGLLLLEDQFSKLALEDLIP